jgi:hypothetical protein
MVSGRPELDCEKKRIFWGSIFEGKLFSLLIFFGDIRSGKGFTGYGPVAN